MLILLLPLDEEDEGVEITPQRQEGHLQQPASRMELWQDLGSAEKLKSGKDMWEKVLEFCRLLWLRGGR